MNNKDGYSKFFYFDDNDEMCDEKDAIKAIEQVYDKDGNMILENFLVRNKNAHNKPESNPKKVVEPERVKISKYIMEKRYYYDENDNSCTKDNASYEVIEIYKMGLLLDRYTVNLNKENNLDFTRYTGK